MFAQQKRRKKLLNIFVICLSTVAMIVIVVLSIKLTEKNDNEAFTPAPTSGFYGLTTSCITLATSPTPWWVCFLPFSSLLFWNGNMNVYTIKNFVVIYFIICLSFHSMMFCTMFCLCATRLRDFCSRGDVGAWFESQGWNHFIECGLFVSPHLILDSIYDALSNKNLDLSESVNVKKLGASSRAVAARNSALRIIPSLFGAEKRLASHQYISSESAAKRARFKVMPMYEDWGQKALVESLFYKAKVQIPNQRCQPSCSKRYKKKRKERKREFKCSMLIID